MAGSSRKSGNGELTDREVKPADAVGTYEERPYAKAISEERREELRAAGIEVTDDTPSGQAATTA